MQSDPITPGPDLAFEQLDAVGTVELDRYCASCGYNLRQQAIRREPSTKLLLCKCPECGVFEPANTLTTATRSWFRGLVAFVWIVWFAIWLNLVGWSIFGVTALAVVSGDVRREWIDTDQIVLDQLVDNKRLEAYRNELANGNTPNASGAAVNHSGFYGNAYDLRPMRDEDLLIMAIFLALSAAIGAVLTTITMVAMPHWKRWGYVTFAVGWPLIGAMIFHGLIWRELYGWRLVTIDLMQWHLICAVSIEAAALVCGLAAVWLGRPVTRGIVRLVVPPQRRGVFAYLWLADGKTPPKTVQA